MLSLSVLNETPVTAMQVAHWTARDPVISMVSKFVLNGWPSQVQEEFQVYYRKKEEILLQDGYLL